MKHMNILGNATPTAVIATGSMDTRICVPEYLAVGFSRTRIKLTASTQTVAKRIEHQRQVKFNLANETVIFYSEIYGAKQQECFELECELICLKEYLGNDPVANFRISMEQTARIKSSEINCNSIPILKRVSLTAFINPREGRLPEEFNERQARALMGVEHPLLNHREKVDARWALDTIAKELRLEPEELINRIEHIAEVKRRVKEIQRKLDNAAVNVEDTDITIDGNDEGEL